MMAPQSTLRRTKIMVTIGPASESDEMLEQLIDAGVDAFRINFSHVNEPEHYAKVEHWIEFILKTTAQKGRNVTIFQDLGGIKVRLGEVKNPFYLNQGDEAILTLEESSSTKGVIPFPRPDLFSKIAPEERIYIADGTIRLDVLENTGTTIRTTVMHGGLVSSHKGVNLPGVVIDEPVLTRKDKFDAQWGVDHGVDSVSVSFVRTEQDAIEAKEYLTSIGSKARIMGKIEKREAVENITGIMKHFDGIMVARGDLGIEVDMEEVPAIQHNLTAQAVGNGCTCCTATQMLISMTKSPRPTRPEVTDVANAVLEGCDCILLSDETATGEYPVDAVHVADRIIRETEKRYSYYPNLVAHDATQITALAACMQARDYNDVVVAVASSTGNAFRAAAKFRPECPIYLISHYPHVLRQAAIVRGTHVGAILPATQNTTEFVYNTVKALFEAGILQPGRNKHLLIIHGHAPGTPGTTSTTVHIDLDEWLSQNSEVTLQLQAS